MLTLADALAALRRGEEDTARLDGIERWARAWAENDGFPSPVVEFCQGYDDDPSPSDVPVDEDGHYAVFSVTGGENADRVGVFVGEGRSIREATDKALAAEREALAARSAAHPETETDDAK